MAVDFARQVYLPSYNVFGRPVTFMPIKSQPAQAVYSGRGIYNTGPIDVETEDGVIFSDMRTILDILEIEFAVLPVQGDQLTIPAYRTIPAAGSFEVIEVKGNGGGETSLTLRRLVTTRP